MFRCEGTTLTVQDNERSFEAGRFTNPSVAELRDLVDLRVAREKFPGRLTVKEFVGDVSELHTFSDNCFATFQAASQFNCLEFTGPDVKPEDGVTIYSSDRTQGPACATACAPGTIVRNYFGMTGGDGRGQCPTQVENLAEVEELLENNARKYFEVVGGYTLATDASLRPLADKLRDSRVRDEALAKLRIGVQWDTEVTGFRFGMAQYEGPKQLVSQAYCSACSVAYSKGSAESWEPLACLVLDAAYEATLYTALQNAMNHDGAGGSKRVFLTALGGGVFGNSPEWILQAMERSFKKFQGVGLEVVIVSFGSPWKAAAHLLREY